MSAESFVRCLGQQVGKPYVWGTAGPNTFDCSGLVAYCWEQTQGEAITRSSVQQFTLGVPVPQNDAQPGDLAFWDTFGEAPGHVAIVENDQSLINALNESEGVTRITRWPTNMGGRNRFMGVRRLFTPESHPDPEPPPKGQRRPNRRRRRRNL
jgi:cell wall-associated NlpC family hydrolase